MPIAVPLAMAAAEYGATTVAGMTAIGTAEAGLDLGTMAYGTFDAADALAATGAASSMTGLQMAGLAASTVSGVGSALTGMAQSNTAKYNAEVAGNNAIIANNNATATIQEGEANAAAASMATKGKIGAILANQGASGVDVNSGSSVDTRSSAAQNGELNAINIRSEAARKAYGYESEAASAKGNQSMDNSEATMSGISGGINAGGALLSGATNPSNPFGQYLASKSMSGDSENYIGT